MVVLDTLIGRCQLNHLIVLDLSHELHRILQPQESLKISAFHFQEPNIKLGYLYLFYSKLVKKKESIYYYVKNCCLMNLTQKKINNKQNHLMIIDVSHNYRSFFNRQNYFLIKSLFFKRKQLP